MLYVVLCFLIIIILFNFGLYIIHKDTSIVDGEIIRIDTIRNSKPGIRPYTTYRTSIMYSYIVNEKKYISTMIDDFGISKFLYKYIKPKSNKKIFQDEYRYYVKTKSNEKFFKDKYTYYVKKKDIKVRYKINNPQDSKINNFILREIIYLFIIAIIFSLIAVMILGLIWYIYQ